MSEPKYSFTVEWYDEDEAFVALCPEFPGLSALGETHEEAAREARVALGLMIEAVKERGELLPEPRTLVFGRAKTERAVLDAVKAWRVAVRAAAGAYEAWLADPSGERWCAYARALGEKWARLDECGVAAEGLEGEG